MSLRGRERRRLSGIAATLDRSDPQLVRLFATFSRLSREEDMPQWERLRIRVDRLTARCRRLRMAALGRLRVIVIAPVALAAACAAVLIGVWSSGPSACKAKPAAAHSLHRAPGALRQPGLCGPVLTRAGVGVR